MAERFDIAIIGSGPAGLSAAARAAELGLSHVLLERTDHLSDTIYKYQKGKFVMATPDVLPLRAAVSFEAGIREDILGKWDAQAAAHKVNVRYKAEVTGVAGQKGQFTVKLARGESIEAGHVVMAIGLQGNLRKLGVPGDDHAMIQYQLDDPGEYFDETIVVIGAGDAAIENAVALARQNKVVIVNRRNEFARAKQGNLNAINKAIESGEIECAWESAPLRVEDGAIILESPKGEARYECNRIIARLGADPPRKFVEGCGVKFSSEDRTAYPEVSPRYESSVPGLYVIGALAGYPLIKNCMNQGYEVVEFIRGADVTPADEPLLEQKFQALPDYRGVDAAIELVRHEVRLFAALTPLQLRDFLLDSEVHVLKQGEIVFRLNDYGDSLFNIVAGEVVIDIEAAGKKKQVVLGAGKFFGEIGLISGRRRSATISAGAGGVVLIETPRRSAIKLINSVPAVKKAMDDEAIVRQLQTYLSQNLTREDLAEVVAGAKVRRFAAGDTLIKEGEADNSVFVIRVGSVTVSRKVAGKDMVLSYIPAGHYVGEMALLRGAARSATVRAAVKGEAIELDGAAFRALLDRNAELREKVEHTFQDRVMADARRESDEAHTGVVQFLVEQGVGEATDVLLIDEGLCVRCDNCEKACAESHDGISRLDREAGPTYAMLHVPTSCRHCEHPHCMADCPPDAIHRAPNGEVYIDQSCIGCGNCAVNCPYGVIQLAAPPPRKPGLLAWLMFGLGPGPGDSRGARKQKKKSGGKPTPKLAVKCDMCKGIKGGPACVRACPTGAAIRVSPEEFFSLTKEGG